VPIAIVVVSAVLFGSIALVSSENGGPKSPDETPVPPPPGAFSDLPPAESWNPISPRGPSIIINGVEVPIPMDAQLISVSDGAPDMGIVYHGSRVIWDKTTGKIKEKNVKAEDEAALRPVLEKLKP
jgi:hypothetical protein